MLFAVGHANELSDTAEIYFHQSRWAIDPRLAGNAATLERLVRGYGSVAGKDALRPLIDVKVVGGASPEGSVAINRRLSDRRAKAIFNYVSSQTGIDSTGVSYRFIGRDWEGLRLLVEGDSGVPFREDVIALLYEIAESSRGGESESAGNLKRIKSLHGGVPYAYMYRNLFPSLRESRIYLTYGPLLRRLAPTAIAVTSLTGGFAAPEPMDRTMMGTPVTGEPARKPLYMALKTNMLYDAAALPTVGAEFYLGKGWSVTADWTYGWWDVDRRHRYWRAYGGDIGVRRWFGRAAGAKPLTGHHVGLYAGAVTYDFELGGRGVMGGLPGRTLWDRCNFLCGVEYGYSLPVSRRVNIDFGLGIGYLGGKVIKYVPQGKYYVWQSTQRFHWFGPTKAEISLVWLIGRGNYNGKKGGGL